MIQSILVFIRDFGTMYFFSQNDSVNVYPVKAVVWTFEKIVATTFVVSISCGSDSP